MRSVRGLRTICLKKGSLLIFFGREKREGKARGEAGNACKDGDRIETLVIEKKTVEVTPEFKF